MKYSILFIVLLFVFLGSCNRSATKGDRVLVFSKTTGYRHESIGPGKLALIQLGKENGFAVDTTEDASVFSEENLKRYRTVVFLSTTQNVLDELQQADFKRYIEAGGGFVGIHAAADTEYEWPWYGKLVGAYFKSHPQIQEAKLKKVRSFGPNTLPDEWVHTDEWYNYKNISKDINVIYTLDETSYKGGENGNNHPIAWYHEFEGGRAFYTGLGHTNEAYSDKLFLEHVLQGIQYAMGETSKLNYNVVKTKRAVEENRFSKTVLDFNLNEPTEMAVFPDGRILFIERKGDVKLFDPSAGKTAVVNTLKPWTKFEDGLIGLTIDPDFATNNFIYLFYSHPERSSNVLSRFVFRDNRIDESSEKEILEVATQRDKCCHTGGSLQFGKDRTLFISTGDNTSPFESDGYSPSDERAGREPFDAQKSSSNTNDLRGKILRIIVNTDGSYTIPKGNLFPEGEDKTRPEIYVMGNRNPYRISVDQRTGYLYWGEVGPDAGNDDTARGPRGYDEINQAKQAGFFGWPYFIGDNYAYARYDFAAKKAGERWDPAKPVNTSPSNTGKRDLPPAQPAFIWYPYARSDEFPMVKEGGRNAMAGPVYYSDQYRGSKTAFPDYYDGKLLIYDWMRNWMFHVTMDQDGAMKDMEPFMPNTKFNNIIDMAYGPDGRLYMLEYGTAWFKQNMDARLVRIDFNGGNRPPVVQLAADKIAGSVPLVVNFTSEGTVDYDNDKLDYMLEVGDKKETSSTGRFKLTFDKPGAYTVTLTARDSKGASNRAQVRVIAGNETPEVDVRVTKGNQTFYFPGTPVEYAVTISDKEDGTSEQGNITNEHVKITFDYLKGYDMTAIAQGHQQPVIELPGKSLIENSDCKSCHLADQRSAGPSYREVAKKYSTQKGAADYLAEKVIRGGAGVWGTIEMAAHPQISVEDARKMVEYIMSFGNDNVASLPLKGIVTPGKEEDGVYLINASYTDKGAGEIPPLSASKTFLLRAPVLSPAHASELNTVRVMNARGRTALENVKHNAYAVYKQVDLTGIKSAKAIAYIQPEGQTGGEVEIRLGGPEGRVWGSATLTGKEMVSSPMKLTSETGFHDLYIIFKNPDAGDKNLYYFGGVQLMNN
jgi:cytochrome c